MWSQIFLGCFLVLVTAIVHMFATAAALVMLKKMGRLLHMNKASTLQRTLLVGGLVASMFLVSVLDAVIWAHVYLRVGAIEQLETALYFSMVTFTTLGYGDVTLAPDWRLLASFEAANGIMMFGLGFFRSGEWDHDVWLDHSAHRGRYPAPRTGSVRPTSRRRLRMRHRDESELSSVPRRIRVPAQS